MKHKKTILILLFSISIAFQKEILTYDLEFMGMNAGETILSIKKEATGDNSIYYLTSTIQTNSFLDKVYKIRDRINVILDSQDFSIKKIEKKIDEGGRKKFFQSIINYDSLTAVSNNKTIAIPGKVLDPFGSIYYLRNKEIKLFDIFEFITYDNDKLKYVKVVAKKIETISTPLGEYECIIIEPDSKNGILLKNKGSMKIWLTNNIEKIPVKIEHVTNIGKMTMVLKNIQQ